MAPRMPKGGALPGLCAAAIAILTLMVPILQAPATTEDSGATASRWRPEDHAHVSAAAHRGQGPQACDHCHGPNMPAAALPKPVMRLSLEDLRAIADHTPPRER